MGGVDHDDVDAGVDELFNAFFGAGTHADGGAHEELALGVLGGERVVGGLRDVLHRHEAGEVEVGVDDENAFEAVLVHEGLGFFERGAFTDRDEAFARRHDFADRDRHAGFEAEVAVRDHAEDLLAVDDGKTRNAVFTSEADDVAHEHVGTDRDRFGDDARFMALHRCRLPARAQWRGSLPSPCPWRRKPSGCSA